MTGISGPHVLTVPAYPATSGELDTSQIIGNVVTILGKVDGAGDLVIVASGDDLRPDVPILSLSVTDDFVVHPRQLIHDTEGTEVADAYNNGIAVYGTINISVTGAEGGDVFSITFLTE